MQPVPIFDDSKAVTKALCAAFVRYGGLMIFVAGQDALDALALVRKETLEGARQAGMAAGDLKRLEQLFLQLARLALKGSGKIKPH